MDNQKEKITFDFGKMLGIALRLIVICTLVAGLVAFVNAFTKDRIELNAKNDTASSLSAIYAADGYAFGVDENGDYAMTNAADGTPAGTLENVTPDETLSDVEAVYRLVLTDGTPFGYFVKVTPMGFNDTIEVLAAVNPNGSLKQVAIKQQDTPGKGDKAENPAYLGGFAGKSAGFTDGLDAKALKESGYVIAGATRTSRPFALAVDTALKQVKALQEGEGE